MERARDKKFTIYKDKSVLILTLDKNSLIYGKENSQAYMLHYHNQLCTSTYKCNIENISCHIKSIKRKKLSVVGTMLTCYSIVLFVLTRVMI